MYFDPVLLPKLRKDFAFDAYVWSIYFKKKTMALFYGWGSAVSRLQSHFEETVYLLLISP